MRKPGTILSLLLILGIVIYFNIQDYNEYRFLNEYGELSIVYGRYDSGINNTNYYFTTIEGKEIAVTHHSNSKRGFDEELENSKILYNPTNPKVYQRKPYSDNLIMSVLGLVIGLIILSSTLGGLINFLRPVFSSSFNKKYSFEQLKKNGVIHFNCGNIFWNYYLPNSISGLGFGLVINYGTLRFVTSYGLLMALFIVIFISFIFVVIKKRNFVSLDFTLTQIRILNGIKNPKSKEIQIAEIESISFTRFSKNPLIIIKTINEEIDIDFNFNNALALKFEELFQELKRNSSN